jgi:radical SAM superfamily enzyme YgiQ (UPF0313 family)
MNILAIYPREEELAVFEKMPPLGMLWIGGVLQREGYGIEFIDQAVDERDPAAVAAQDRPGLALIGGTSHSRFISFSLAEQIKQASPETVVVYGGPHATFTAVDTLTHIAPIDIIVRGEGERTCLELAAWAAAGGRREDLQRIPGIAFRENGSIAQTAPQRPIEDLDSLGPPARGLVPMDRYRMFMDYRDLSGASIMTARGCPIGCSFCSASAMFGTSYRARSPAAVVDEIEELITRYGIGGFKIFDSTFTLQRRHAEGFCEELQRRGINTPWECEVRVGSVDKRLLATMQQAGCYYIDVGIESGSQRVLDQCIRKQISLDAAEELLRWTSELGLLTKVFFTLGHPGETYEEGKSTNRFIWRNRKHIRLCAYHAGIRVYPGTEVERYARTNNLLPEGFRWSSPYQNLANRRLFRSIDSIPLLLQKGLGLRELRRLRLQFIIMRVSSPRFVLEKLRAIVKMGAVVDYFRILFRGTKRNPSDQRVEKTS